MPGGITNLDVETRATLHLVAAHILGRRRHDVTGRFGLRSTPGGFGTPAFGDAPEVVRVSGTAVVREVGGEASAVTIAGSTLGQLAEFCGTDLLRSFSAGGDMPRLPDRDLPLTIDPATADALARWYGLGWVVLDDVVCGLGADARPTTIQLWPEHFDAGTTVTVAGGEKVNLGFSPGDAFEPAPYVYLGPWGSERPGGAGFWNAPFGAVLTAREAGTNAAERCLAFLNEGLRRVSGGGR